MMGTKMILIFALIYAIIHMSDYSEVNSMGGRILELPSDQLRRAEANGEKRGITIGEARGEDRKTVNVIRNMLLRGQSDEDIIGIAECTQEQIDRVRESLQ